LSGCNNKRNIVEITSQQEPVVSTRGSETADYSMNANWNSGNIFYNADGYYFSDPRGYDDCNITSISLLDYFYKTDETFEVFEIVEDVGKTQLNYDWNMFYNALKKFEKIAGPKEEEILAFNEYRGFVYYSIGNKLFAYDTITKQHTLIPVDNLENYDIVSINICGEKLFLGAVLPDVRRFMRYSVNFGGATTYISNLDGSDLREIAIPQCKDSFQTFIYKSQGFGVSCPLYWYMYTDEGSNYHGCLMIFSPKYDFFMVAGKSEYADKGPYIGSPKEIEKGNINTKKGLNATYSIQQGEDTDNKKELFKFYFLISKDERQYHFSAIGSYETLLELKSTFIEIAESFDIL
jgi:hypothetical protein